MGAVKKKRTVKSTRASFDNHPAVDLTGRHQPNFSVRRGSMKPLLLFRLVNKAILYFD